MVYSTQKFLQDFCNNHSPEILGLKSDEEYEISNKIIEFYSHDLNIAKELEAGIHRPNPASIVVDNKFEKLSEFMFYTCDLPQHEPINIRSILRISDTYGESNACELLFSKVGFDDMLRALRCWEIMFMFHNNIENMQKIVSSSVSDEIQKKLMSSFVKLEWYTVEIISRLNLFDCRETQVIRKFLNDLQVVDYRYTMVVFVMVISHILTVAKIGDDFTIKNPYSCFKFCTERPTFTITNKVKDFLGESNEVIEKKLSPMKFNLIFKEGKTK